MSCDVALMNYMKQVKGMLLLANVELAVAVEASDFLRNPLAPAGPCLWSRSGFSSNYRTWSVRMEHCSLIGVRGNVFWVLGKAMVVVVKSFADISNIHWYCEVLLVLVGHWVAFWYSSLSALMLCFIDQPPICYQFIRNWYLMFSQSFCHIGPVRVLTVGAVSGVLASVVVPLGLRTRWWRFCSCVIWLYATHCEFYSCIVLLDGESFRLDRLRVALRCIS